MRESPTHISISRGSISAESAARIFTCIIYISRGTNEHVTRPAGAEPRTVLTIILVESCACHSAASKGSEEGTLKGEPEREREIRGRRNRAIPTMQSSRDFDRWTIGWSPPLGNLFSEISDAHFGRHPFLSRK